MVYSYNGILLSDKKEETPGTYHNVKKNLKIMISSEKKQTQKVHTIWFQVDKVQASQVVLVVKNPAFANAGDIRVTGSISGSGRTPGGGHSNPLRYSYLENPTDRGATIRRDTKT